MAINWRGLVKDKKLWAAGAAGGALGLYMYLKRRQAGGAAATTDTGQPIAGAVGDSGAVDAYNNLQSELENLQGQITALYGGAPLPSGQQAVAPKPPIAKLPRYVTTRKLGGAGGHPVSYDYLTRIGLLKRQGGRYVTTGKFGTSAGHPVSYQYLARTGYLRSA